MIQRLTFPALAALCLGGSFGCSDSSLMMERNDGDYSDSGSESEAPYDTGHMDGSDSEAEDDFLALEPAQTDVFVFIANPGRGTVTRVNVFTQEVRTTQVGNNPSTVTVAPDYSNAVVFNKGSDSVSIIDSLSLDVLEVGVRDNFNRMKMSPQGSWVGLFHDKRAEEDGDPVEEGIQSFNEVSFVSVPDGVHHAMAVGFNPREIQFTKDDTLAVVVSDEAVALVDLTSEKLIPRIIDITMGATDPPPAEEVVINPTGTYAFVRQFGATDLLVVDLATESIETVNIGTNPTDLDLSPDGSIAVVVSRSSQELYVLDADAPLETAPQVLSLPESLYLGSLLFDPVGEQALIYTTASNTPYYAVWDLENEITLRPLAKPVRSMSITPTGESVMVIHTKEDAPDADPNGYFYDAWALSLIDLGDFRQNTLKLPAETTGYANSTNGIHGYFIMDGVKLLAQVDYDTLLYEQINLKSDPVYVGVLPDLDPEDGDEPPAWASQEHELGRLTFFDPDDGSVETITGFELNSRIED